MEELVRLSAGEAVALLRKREVSPLDLLEAAARRIEAVDGRLNALPTLCLDRAADRARRMSETLPKETPGFFLHGLPVAVKDLEDVAGVRTTYGSPVFSHHVPDRSCTMVENLEANGALVIGKSNTPEFGAGGHTFNEVFGTTANPWDTNRSCGGSSGGSAVALASGEVWLATGSDLGGSLRTPAAFCSVVGLRPSPGRVPAGPGPLPFETLPVLGPMGRDVRDTALLLDAQLGWSPGDPLSLPPPAVSFSEALERPRLPARVGFTEDLGILPVDPAVRGVFRSALSTWEELGVRLEEAHPDCSDVPRVYQTLRARFFASRFEPILETHRDLLKPEIVWNTEKGLALTGEEIGRAERERGEIFRAVMGFFDEFDLLVHPAAVVPPFDRALRYPGEVDGRPMETYMDWLTVTFLSSLTACPSLSVPCGFSPSGLPVGLMIMAPPRREDRLLEAALLFEQHLGLHARVPLDPVAAPA
jgi:amidase